MLVLLYYINNLLVNHIYVNFLNFSANNILLKIASIYVGLTFCYVIAKPFVCLLNVKKYYNLCFLINYKN